MTVAEHLTDLLGRVFLRGERWMERAERAERERDAWIESARQFHRNECYYRELVVEIGEMFGDPAYVSDDGSRQQDVLCAKVPELVRAALKERSNG